MAQEKRLIFEQFALVGQALGSGHRLELLDVLVQGDRGVDALARAAGLSVANASQHLLLLRRAGLVNRRRAGRRVIYALNGPEVWSLVRALRLVAEGHLVEVDRLVRDHYRDRDVLEPVPREQLQARVRDESVVVLDVRSAEEYAAGHLPGAVSIPLEELAERLIELPADTEIVACCRGPYCVYSYEAVEILRPHGLSARRLDGGFSEWLAAGLPIVRQSSHAA
ncbi:MAG: ArsR/SmtB family transcription factor [Microbacteriaceae bacterium]